MHRQIKYLFRVKVFKYIISIMIKLYSIVYKEINQLVHCGLFSFYTFSFLTIILLIRTSQDKPNHSFIISPLGNTAAKIRADVSVSEQLREESQMQSRHLIRSAGWGCLD